MAIDFPASPTVSQEYTSGGMTYVYNGTGWTIKGGSTTALATTVYVDAQDALKVAKAGDTMSGPLVLPADPTLALQAAPKQYVDAVRVAAAPMDAMAYNGMQVNGSMEVSQENSGEVSFSNGTLKYAVDGWLMGYNNSSAVFVGGQTAGGGLGAATASKIIYFRATTAMSGSVATDFAVIRQHIEGYRIARLGWGFASAIPITIGFWVQSTRGGHATLAIMNAAATLSYCVDVLLTANTLEYKTITIPPPYSGTWNIDNTTGMMLTWTFASGASYQTTGGTWVGGGMFSTPAQTNFFTTSADTVTLAHVVILPGTQAPTAAQSPLIMRPYDQELVTCQRYLRKNTYYENELITSLQIVNATTANGRLYSFSPIMRSDATVTNSGVGMFLVQSPGGGGTIPTALTIGGNIYGSWVQIATLPGTGGHAPGMAALFYATFGAWIMHDARL